MTPSHETCNELKKENNTLNKIKLELEQKLEEKTIENNKLRKELLLIRESLDKKSIVVENSEIEKKEVENVVMHRLLEQTNHNENY